jgi:hypothetical protein
MILPYLSRLKKEVSHKKAQEAHKRNFLDP